MKQFVMMVFLLLGGTFFNTAYGGVQQTIPMHIIDEGELGGGNTLAPPRPWYIAQDENVLTIPAFEDDLTLQLRDEDDTVVYSTIISAGTTQVILPSILSGEFELRLIPFFSTYYYRGYIEL